MLRSPFWTITSCGLAQTVAASRLSGTGWRVAPAASGEEKLDSGTGIWAQFHLGACPAYCHGSCPAGSPSLDLLALNATRVVHTSICDMAPSHARLLTLIDRACSRNQPDLDASALKAIKTLCRQNDNLVLVAWEALWVQLRATHAQVGATAGAGGSLCGDALARWCASLPHQQNTLRNVLRPHSQTRLLALRVCAQLFHRSRAFRLALLAQLSQASALGQPSAALAHRTEACALHAQHVQLGATLPFHTPDPAVGASQAASCLLAFQRPDTSPPCDALSTALPSSWS